MEEVIRILIINLLIIFVICTPLDANAAFMFKFSTGAASINYSENHYVDATKDTVVEEYLLSTKVGFMLPILSKYLALSGDAQYLSPLLSSTTTQDITFLNYNGRLTFLIPSKPFNIEAAAEYFSDSATASDATFGYADESGVRYVAIINIFIPMIATNLNLYYPFLSPDENNEEYRATIEYFFGMGGKEDENVLLKGGTTFEITYEYKKFHNPQTSDPIDARVRTISASFGVLF